MAGTTIEQLDPGLYYTDVALTGGTGKASVQSPCEMTVTDTKAEALIIWSSSNYDYMIVDGEKYIAEFVDGKSAFSIPVAALDEALPVIADTTAMSTPHEIEYTLTFDSSTLEIEGAFGAEAPGEVEKSTSPVVGVGALLLVAAGLAAMFAKKRMSAKSGKK